MVGGQLKDQFLVGRRRKLFARARWFPASPWPELKTLPFNEVGAGAAGVTVLPRSDGGGAQVHAMASALAFARRVGVPFFARPMVEVAHAPDGLDAPWVTRWNETFNPASWGPPLGDRTVVPVTSARQALRLLTQDPSIVVGAPHFHDFTDAFPESYLPVLPSLRNAWSPYGSSASTLFDSRVINVAVHVRRGDVSLHDRDMRARFTSTAKLAAVISSIRESNPTVAMHTHVFTESPTYDLLDLESQTCTLHTSPDVFEVLRHLVGADVFIMAKSSLSFVAALIAQGVVIYEPFWHSPLPTWLEWRK